MYVPEAQVRYAYGAMADVGAGPYDRADVHDAVLAGDLWTRPGADEAPGTDDQVAVGAGATPDVATALDAVAAGWAAPGSTTIRATVTVSIGDSGSYDGDLVVDVPAATRLVLVAATWPSRALPDGTVEAPRAGRYVPDGLRPHVRGTLTVTGGAGSSVAPRRRW